MSSLSNTLKIIGISSVDLATGYAIAFFMDKVFTWKFPVSPVGISKERYGLKCFGYATVQAATTVLIGDSIRSAIYPPGFEDPTGGICFLASLLRQPSLFKKLDDSYKVLDEYIKTELLPRVDPVATSQAPRSQMELLMERSEEVFTSPN